MNAFDYGTYLVRLKSLIKTSVENYGLEGSPKLKDVLVEAGLDKYYVKFNGWLNSKELKRPLSYESFEQLSMLDYDDRSPLQIRAHLQGEILKDYSELSKKQLIDLLISLDH